MKIKTKLIKNKNVCVMDYDAVLKKVIDGIKLGIPIIKTLNKTNYKNNSTLFDF